MIGAEEAVVLEGSTIVAASDPSLCLFVVHPFLAPDRWKPTSAGLLARADAVVVNVPLGESRRPSRAVLDEVRRHRGRGDIREGDVTRPLADWAPDLAECVRRLASAPRATTA